MVRIHRIMFDSDEAPTLAYVHMGEVGEMTMHDWLSAPVRPPEWEMQSVMLQVAQAGASRRCPQSACPRTDHAHSVRAAVSHFHSRHCVHTALSLRCVGLRRERGVGADEDRLIPVLLATAAAVPLPPAGAGGSAGELGELPGGREARPELARTARMWVQTCGLMRAVESEAAAGAASHEAVAEGEEDVEALAGSEAACDAPEVALGGAVTFQVWSASGGPWHAARVLTRPRAPQSDIWRLGVALYRVAVGVSRDPVAVDGRRVQVPRLSNARQRDLISRLLAVDPGARCSAAVRAFGPRVRRWRCGPHALRHANRKHWRIRISLSASPGTWLLTETLLPPTQRCRVFVMRCGVLLSGAQRVRTVALLRRARC